MLAPRGDRGRVMRRLFNNEKHWRDRAEETRSRADQMKDPEARRILLDIAAGYARLAELAEARKATKHISA